jgi:hypothetical protein
MRDKPIDDREGSVGSGTISGTGWELMVKSWLILSIAAPASLTEQATSYEAHPWKLVRISHCACLTINLEEVYPNVERKTSVSKMI